MLALVDAGKDTIIHLDPQFLMQVAFQIFNALVAISIIGYLLYEPVKKFLHNRSERIANQLDHAAQATNDADRLKSEYELKYKNIQSERDIILSEARKIAHERESRIIAEAKKEASLIIKRANMEIEREKSKAMDDMRHQIIEISSLLASRYVSNSIDIAAQNKLLDEVIQDLGDVQWIN